MRPDNLKTKIFLDSGDPEETKAIIKLLGFLDGQTTNPSLVSKNPEAKDKIAHGNRFSKEEIYKFYKKIITEISELIPDGSVSIEVYADNETSSEEMLNQGKEMFAWIPNAHVKFPIIKNGLAATKQATAEGMRVNMTLNFTQEQAAAVYATTQGAKKGEVFVSPFVGRLDDTGENGMDLIKNILEMYSNSDKHVNVLAASIRNLNHFLYAIKLGADIITAPVNVLKEWAETGMKMPENDFVYPTDNLAKIEYKKIALDEPWEKYNISNYLTDKGIEKFADDWNKLIGN